jgi:hypothetical protein
MSIIFSNTLDGNELMLPKQMGSVFGIILQPANIPQPAKVCRNDARFIAAALCLFGQSRRTRLNPGATK